MAIVSPLSTAQEWVVGPAPSKAGTEPLANQRWMHEMTMIEFYDIYVGTCEGQPASLSTFTRAWFRGGWDRKIKFRPVGTHSACPHCTRLREWRRLATCEADREKIATERIEHVTRILLDRAVNARLNEIAARTMGEGPTKLPTDICQIALTIDGMDQAKFKVPRWGPRGNSKELQPLWRPQLHVHGVLIYGCLEAFFLCNLNIPKDANMQCTCMARALHLASKVADARALNMPRFWRSHFDNTSSEGKNAVCFSFYSVGVLALPTQTTKRC